MARLNFEAYMIRRGFVQLTIQDWRKLPASYAGRLHIMLTEMDKIEQERQKREAENARGRGY